MNDNNQLEKVLGRKEVITLSLGAIIGWGWVVLSGGILIDAGSSGAMISFLIAAVMFSFIGLTYAELASALPFAGGEHVYTHKALGKHASFICTWSLILTYVAVVALQAAALPVAFEYFFPDMKYVYLWTVAGHEVYLSYVLLGVLVAGGITTLNVMGLKFSANFQNIVTAFIVIIGFVFAAGAFWGGDTANLEPAFKDGFTGISAALVVIPFMLSGFDVIPQAAEEINMKPRAMARWMLITIFFAIAWYMMVVWALGLSMPSGDIERASFSVADGASRVFDNPIAGKLLIACGIAGILTSWNAFMIGGSRAIYAMAHSKMLPKGLAAIHPTRKSPYNALILIGVLTMIAPFFGRQAMIFVVDAGGFSLLIAYAFVAISFLVMRRKFPNLERPFKVKYGVFVGLMAVTLSFGLAILFLPTMPAALVPMEWWIVLLWYIVGSLMYVWALKKYKPE